MKVLLTLLVSLLATIPGISGLFASISFDLPQSQEVPIYNSAPQLDQVDTKGHKPEKFAHKSRRETKTPKAKPENTRDTLYYTLGVTLDNYPTLTIARGNISKHFYFFIPSDSETDILFDLTVGNIKKLIQQDSTSLESIHKILKENQKNSSAQKKFLKRQFKSIIKQAFPSSEKEKWRAKWQAKKQDSKDRYKKKIRDFHNLSPEEGITAEHLKAFKKRKVPKTKRGKRKTRKHSLEHYIGRSASSILVELEGDSSDDDYSDAPYYEEEDENSEYSDGIDDDGWFTSEEGYTDTEEDSLDSFPFYTAMHPTFSQISQKFSIFSDSRETAAELISAIKSVLDNGASTSSDTNLLAGYNNTLNDYTKVTEETFGLEHLSGMELLMTKLAEFKDRILRNTINLQKTN